MSISRLRLLAALGPLLLAAVGSGTAAPAPRDDATPPHAAAETPDAAGTRAADDIRAAGHELPDHFLGGAELVLTFPAPVPGPSARTGAAPARWRPGSQRNPRVLPARASRAVAARVARLEFAHTLDAARSGDLSLQGTSLPPPPGS